MDEKLLSLVFPVCGLGCVCHSCRSMVIIIIRILQQSGYIDFLTSILAVASPVLNLHSL